MFAFWYDLIKYGKNIFGDLMWILYAILSSFFGSLMVIFMKIGLKDIDSTVGLFIRTIFVLLLLLGLLLITGKIKEIDSFKNKTWIYLIISSIVTFLTWLFYFLALKNGSSNVVMAIDKCSIVFVVIIGAIFLKEKITLNLIIGLGLLIIGSVIIAYN